MAADVFRIANSLSQATLAAKLERMRDEIAQSLKEKGSFSLNEGGQTVTFTLKVGATAKK